jgi:hypothetical protein
LSLVNPLDVSSVARWKDSVARSTDGSSTENRNSTEVVGYPERVMMQLRPIRCSGSVTALSGSCLALSRRRGHGEQDHPTRLRRSTRCPQSNW